MFPVSWPEFSQIHPFAPTDQTRGYDILFHQLEEWLAEITGFAAVSLQPNAGSQGEYAGLLAIYHHNAARGQGWVGPHSYNWPMAWNKLFCRSTCARGSALRLATLCWR